MLNCAHTEFMLSLVDEHAQALRTSLRLASATFSAAHPAVKILRLRIERAEQARKALLRDHQRMAQPV